MSTFILSYNLYPAPTRMYLQPACYVLAFVCTHYRRLPRTEHSPVTSVLFEPHWPYHIQTPHHPLRALWSKDCLCLFQTVSPAAVCWADCQLCCCVLSWGTPPNPATTFGSDFTTSALFPLPRIQSDTFLLITQVFTKSASGHMGSLDYVL